MLTTGIEVFVIKNFEANFKGKVGGRLKKKNQSKNKREKVKISPKVKQRLRNKKNVGKRRVATSEKNSDISNDGLLPLKRK